MKRSIGSSIRKTAHQVLRAGLSVLPKPLRFALFRWMVDCDPQPDRRLELKIADTQDELEACFRILHDAYVAAGFMAPDPSGMRVTIYHALPTTTTLCAKFDGRVVGTITMIREGVFGFPLQSVFDLTAVRANEGRVAEISALAVHPDFRKTGGKILFPLMKFMYEYCRQYFDARHLVIAVNPNKIELYESLLFFDRLQSHVVDRYDFANGAPAVGAALDLLGAPNVFAAEYGRRSPRKNLHRYFVETQLANIKLPTRQFFTTNDPVLTPEMMDYFFNRRTRVFDTLDDRKRLLLQSIYDLDEYRPVLPKPTLAASDGISLRRHQRYSIRCPARLIVKSYGGALSYDFVVIELSLHGFLAECRMPLPEGTRGRLEIDLGTEHRAVVDAMSVRRIKSAHADLYGFRVQDPDTTWRACVDALQTGCTHADLAERVQTLGPARRAGPALCAA